MLDKLSEMKMFQAVADAGGFTAAATELGVSQSMVSRAVLRLEQRLGTSLLHRSTRRISLTDEGAIFLQACRQVLEDIGEAERSVTSDKQPSGTLRVSAAVVWGLDPLVPSSSGIHDPPSKDRSASVPHGSVRRPDRRENRRGNPARTTFGFIVDRQKDWRDAPSDRRFSRLPRGEGPAKGTRRSSES